MAKVAKIVEGEVQLPAPVAANGAPVPSEAASLLTLIERLAADPNIDPDRVERMYALYERAAARGARLAYDAAMAVMQPKLPVIEKRGQIKIRNEVQSKFARWEDIAEPVLKITHAHGFSLTFRVKREESAVNVTAVLAHKDGHREETTLPLPIDASGNKNAVQAIGSSTSYGKRYTACLLLNIITKDEDDDGAGAGKATGETINAKQVATLKNMLKSTKSNDAKFCEYMSRVASTEVTKIEEIPASKFQAAMDALDEKMKRQI